MDVVHRAYQKHEVVELFEIVYPEPARISVDGSPRNRSVGKAAASISFQFVERRVDELALLQQFRRDRVVGYRVAGVECCRLDSVSVRAEFQIPLGPLF